MKIKKVKYEDILCYEQFMMKYGKDIKKKIINKKIINMMVATMNDDEMYIFDEYIEKVQDILIAIAEVKYMDPGRPDVGSIFKIFRSTCYLSEDRNIQHFSEYYDLKKIYNMAFDELKESGYREYFIGKENEIDYSFDKLLDLEYHLNNFRNYCNKDDPYNEEFIDILNRELWRFT